MYVYVVYSSRVYLKDARVRWTQVGGPWKQNKKQKVLSEERSKD